MRQQSKLMLYSLVFVLAFSQMLIGSSVKRAKAEETNKVEDLVIYQNIPEVESVIKDGQIQLKEIGRAHV